MIEDAAPASAMTHAAMAPVPECIAPAPTVEATQFVSGLMPLDVYDATLVEIFDDVHQSMKRIHDLPPGPVQGWNPVPLPPQVGSAAGALQLLVQLLGPGACTWRLRPGPRSVSMTPRPLGNCFRFFASNSRT